MPFLLFVPYEVPIAGGGPVKEFDLLANSRFISEDDLKRIRQVLSVDQGSPFLERFHHKVVFVESTEMDRVRLLLSRTNTSGIVPEFDLLDQSAFVVDNITYEALYAFAATLDGSGDYATSAYDASDEFVTWTGSTQFTIEMWIKPVGGLSYFDAVQHPTLIGHRTPASTIDYWSFGPINTGEVCLYTFDGSPNLHQSGLSVNMNAWNHIALTKTGSGIEFHVNGVSSTRNSFSVPNFAMGYPLSIGSGNGTGFNGLISMLNINSTSAFYEGTYDVPEHLPEIVASSELILFDGPSVVDSSTNERPVTVAGDLSMSSSDVPF